MAAERWTDRTIKAIKKTGYHKDPESRSRGIDKGALYLQVRKGAPSDGFTRSWLYRYQLDGKQRWMGLGAYPGVGLSDAREMARKASAMLREGIDPVEVRRARRAESRREKARNKSFKDVAEDFIKSKQLSWKNGKHAQQWENTLSTYVYPHFGDLPVQEIDSVMVKEALTPIWYEKTETATRVRQRMETIFNAAEAAGYREGKNPARLEAMLHMGLARAADIQTVRHHPALPYQQMSAFMEALRAREGVAAKGFTFLILTASRVGPVLVAEWSEVDLEKRIWTCPAAHMKIKRRRGKETDHRVPLSEDAMRVLREIQKFRESDFIFPSIGKKKGLSNGAFDRVIDRMRKAQEWPHITTHGFRSTFRTWAQEKTLHQREVAEAALAHVIGDETEEAYAHGDFFEKRRRLMDDWAKFCSMPYVESEGGNVVALHGGTSA